MYGECFGSAYLGRNEKSIMDSGGMFYQYRPCRRDASTIYDIENIRHGVIYAQTPLNMNDPFDSMIGFSAEKIYDNIITMLTDSLSLDSNLKIILSAVLKYKAFGKLAELMLLLKEQKRYLEMRRNAAHQTHVQLDSFVQNNAYTLYSKAPKKLKENFTPLSFTAFSLFVSHMGNVDISEDNILSMLKMDDLLDKLHSQAENIRDTLYVPELRKFLSKLTVSCFSASGWDNQLMWSHYANSYTGICVEYDFTQIDKFIGFIYPVNYTTNRPTLTMQDLGVSAIDLNSEEKIVKCDTNTSVILSYLLSKNTCWSYEDEWRIINIGEENTPRFIDMPYIKSITLGLNIDPICKRLLSEVCKERDIPCYELNLSKEHYFISRTPVTDMPFDFGEEIAYVEVLSSQMAKTSEMLVSSSGRFSVAAANGQFDKSAYFNTIVEEEEYLSNSYYVKSALNRIYENADKQIIESEVPEGIILAINGIESFVATAADTTEKMQQTLIGFMLKGLIGREDLKSAKKHLDNITELVERFKGYPWHTVLKAAIEAQNGLVESAE